MGPELWGILALLDNFVILGRLPPLWVPESIWVSEMKMLESMTSKSALHIRESTIPGFWVICQHNDLLFNSTDRFSYNLGIS